MLLQPAIQNGLYITTSNGQRIENGAGIPFLQNYRINYVLLSAEPLYMLFDYQIYLKGNEGASNPFFIL
jgi:hypothetical protein